ncbi:MAG: ubiquinol-cytochrome c reductase iron-sulfur subunit [Wenzhouxiangellaceae bacterium]
MSDEGVNKGRRQLLTWTTAVVGAVGAGFAAVPFIQSWQPSAKARLVGGPVEVNLAPLKPGQLLKAQWRGQTIGILRRTPEMLETLNEVRDNLRDPDSSVEDQQPEYAANAGRSLRPEYLVANIHCTHLGCVPQLVPEVGPQPFDEDWKGGFFCPCHKSRFDLAGRVYKGVPAQLNLLIPPYRYSDDTTIQIGLDPEGGAA